MKRIDLIKMRQENVAREIYTSPPALIAEAKRVVPRDLEGKEYLDFSGGIGFLNVGHSAEAVVEVVCEQAKKFLHSCFMVQMYEPYIALAKELNR